MYTVLRTARGSVTDGMELLEDERKSAGLPASDVDYMHVVAAPLQEIFSTRRIFEACTRTVCMACDRRCRVHIYPRCCFLFPRKEGRVVPEVALHRRDRFHPQWVAPEIPSYPRVQWPPYDVTYDPVENVVYLSLPLAYYAPRALAELLGCLALWPSRRGDAVCCVSQDAMSSGSTIPVPSGSMASGKICP